MNKRKVLITGADGQLGRAVRERFADDELICTDVGDINITILHRVQEFVQKYEPDAIINCAAYNDVDGAELKKELAYAVNCIGPRNLAMAANSVKAKLVHISTDYVFDGKRPITDIYEENDDKNPQSVYGCTKYNGENEIKRYITTYYIFRTAWLFGDGNNFVRKIMELGKKQDEVKVVYDQYGSPTYANDLADIIYQALEKKIPMGTYHATNLGFTNWYDFTKEIFKQAGIQCRVIPVTSEELPRAAARPKNSMLAKGKILGEDIEIASWEDALARYLEKEKNKI
ncbi:MAG: dTDP-4-dehydrorhamnose reductase [Clostridia bacterium]|nr:dTDP-4-dehydrorhamnose reductase [Clostridia bacterium]